MMEEKILLTQYSRGAGCGCKIAPQVLKEILKSDALTQNFPDLLVGNSSNDDAAVYDLGNGQSLIATTDFFMPVVDDAYDFGRIAAANAISDVYAMGGKPLMALAILGWPVEKLPASLAQQVMDGARAICNLANIPLAGGHSIDSVEPFFGLSVNGLINTDLLKKNNTAQSGDLLLLTKPLGTGVLSTAQKRGLLPEALLNGFIEQLTQLNSIGTELAKHQGVHAITDITGFGILGHLIEMAEGSGLNAILDYHHLPVMEGVKALIGQRVVPDATFRNWNSYSAQVGFDKGVNVMEAFSLLPDPQTNGGLLISVAPEALPDIRNILISSGLSDYTTPIGRFHTNQQDKRILVS